jgi:hypothetical protein
MGCAKSHSMSKKRLVKVYIAAVKLGISTTRDKTQFYSFPTAKARKAFLDDLSPGFQTATTETYHDQPKDPIKRPKPASSPKRKRISPCL